MTNDNEFDTLLDQALAEYSQAEPVSGMEDRVLERIRRQPEPRRLWWYWAAAGALAVLLVAVWMGQRSGHRRQDAVPITRQQALPATPVAPAPQISEAKTMKQPSAKLYWPQQGSVEAESAAVRQVRKEFPEPAPLTREERAVLALANSRPDELRSLTRPDKDQEIAIAPIAIAPLAEPDGIQGDN
jgi:hypothetical protein